MGAAGRFSGWNGPSFSEGDQGIHPSEGWAWEKGFTLRIAFFVSAATRNRGFHEV